MHPVFSQIAAVRLVPVIVLHDAAHAAPLAESLVAGGLPCAEVTFRTPAAAASLRAMVAHGGDSGLLVGAGTVLRVDQVKEAVDLGARFIVSPGFSPKVVGYCVEHGIPVSPGVCTPTDLMQALEHGLEVVKFFPAETAGGVEALKALGAPFGDAVRFIPTGGITAASVGRYLALPRVLACGGSWMVPDGLIRAGDFVGVTALVREAVASARADIG